jgi:hypothetical protein
LDQSLQAAEERTPPENSVVSIKTHVDLVTTARFVVDSRLWNSNSKVTNVELNPPPFMFRRSLRRKLTSEVNEGELGRDVMSTKAAECG